MSEYVELLYNYIDVFSIIGSGLKTGFISFFAMLIVLLILRKYVLVRRRYAIIKYIAYSYFFFMPMLCLCFGFIYGVVSTSKENIINQLPTLQTNFQHFAAENLDRYISVHINVEQSPEQIVENGLSPLQQKITLELNSAKKEDDFIAEVVLTVINSPIGIDYIKTKLKKVIAEKFKTNRELVDEVFKMRVSEIFKGDGIVKIAILNIEQIAQGILTPLTIIWLILLFMPLLEIILSNRYHKKYLAAMSANDDDVFNGRFKYNANHHTNDGFND